MKNKDKFKANFLKYIELCIKNGIINIDIDNGQLYRLYINDYHNQLDCKIFQERIDFTIFNISDSFDLTVDEYNQIIKTCNEYTYSDEIMNQLLDLIKDVEKE